MPLSPSAERRWPQTVQQLTGVPLDGAMIANFGSVHELVDAVDGVRVCVPYQVDSILSDKVWTEGCHDMTGTDADEFMRRRSTYPAATSAGCAASNLSSRPDRRGDRGRLLPTR